MERISKIVSILEKGDLIIFPTETIYALAGRADNIDTISRIYQIKYRSLSKPLSIFVKNIKQINNFTNLTEYQKKIINYLSPGAVTFILPLDNKDTLNSKFFHSQTTIGIRIPNHPIALAILKLSNFPIVATSTNISNEPNIVSAVNIPEYIKKNVAIIINNDNLVTGIQSTIIDLTTNNLKVLRQGGVADNSLIALLKKL